VDITLTSPTRTVVWEDAFRFVGETEITRTSITSSSIAGAVTITITGRNFYGLDNFDSLEFGDVAASSFDIVTSTSITAVVPANVAGDTEIQIDAAGGRAEFDFTYRGAPKISGVSPRTAVAMQAPASSVVISGMNFISTVTVKVGGGTSVPNSINSGATAITITAGNFPKKVVSEVDVEVSTTYGTAVLTDGFEYVTAPPPAP